MLLRVGYLTNTETGRIHPIAFQRNPLPGNADESLPAKRYKSAGHHTKGFATAQEAQSWTEENKERGLTEVPNLTIEWDGTEIPATVIFLPD